ncbi:hypothetical protein [Pontiella agarivorans]|uniref:Uncharacterized protein n=1 Tax=Pontiella agarivorans TaxID=3038953 RepID=A0ABU5N0L5_9BACT|nr:hypothetical protein [Pontiella agarivorans]MDZ8119968.1 hypothetical protein [Pontiella agarivorans]
MTKQLHLIPLLLLLLLPSRPAVAVTTWKGGVSGYWDVPTNWAGGYPASNTTVRLNHDRQTNAYTVVVSGPATTDKLWIDTYGSVPVHLLVNPSGSLELYSMRMGFKEDDRESGFTIDGGSVLGMEAASSAITNTAFLIGNNPGCIATLDIINDGTLSVMGSNGLVAAGSKESIGRITVTNGTMNIRDSLTLGKGPQALGELQISGTSSVSITGMLHMAKLELGALSPTGTVHVSGGSLECGGLNIGARGTGSFTLEGGQVQALAGGITLGQFDSSARLNIFGGTMETIGSPLTIGQLDSSADLCMTNGFLNIDGAITLGASSRTAGSMLLTGGTVHTKELIISSASSSTGTVHIQGGTFDVDETVQVGPEGTGALHLECGILRTTDLVAGGGAAAACTLTGGELIIRGPENSDLALSNSLLHLEKTLIQWSNPNLSAWVSNSVSSGSLTWTNGMAYGTLSSNGFDGCLTNQHSLLFWDNLDNGSFSTQSVLWVEESPYLTWTDSHLLYGSNALWSADPDQDGQNNLIEFGLGGNPTNGPDPETRTTFLPRADLNQMEFTYRRRSQPAAYGLTYQLEHSSDLVTPNWTTAEFIPFGESAPFEDFVTVTNRIPMNHEHRYIRLSIQLD